MHARRERIGQDHVAIEAAADAVLTAGIEHEVGANAGTAGHHQKAIHRLHSLQGGSSRPKGLSVQYNTPVPTLATPTACRHAEFMPARHPKLGVLLLGHGTASETGRRQFLTLSRQLAEQLAPRPVEPAFLELAQPDIAAGVRRLREREITQVVVAPLLLFAAGHAKQDIPDAVAAAFAGSGQRQTVVQAKHLGCHPAIVELSQQRFREAVANCKSIPAAETALILVGRGSRDESATAEMHEFARLRHDFTTGDNFVTFLAMAQPSLAETLTEVARRGFRRVLVQPHLLFHGELADTVQQAVAEIQAQHADQQWLITPLLADSQDSPSGGNQLLLGAVIDRVEAAIRVVA
jgi:sirohydrochlorin cobaltochelatase